ncbi:DUF6265 family protein [Sphingomonas sp. LT1P40]|uniref:DUF6265 family protein n=1 Tax=Alteristakelama amylovorans TaxID=3096166 RepID=UPI002FC60DB8
MMIRLMFALSMLAVPVSASDGSGLPDWLAGRWCGEDGPQGQTCEQWQRGAGGTMLGTSQTVKGDETVGFEFLRIAMDGTTPVYFAQPGGKPPVAFRAVPGGEGVTFVNAAHDYPQRIHYRADGDGMIAEISLADGSEAMRWRLRKAD